MKLVSRTFGFFMAFGLGLHLCRANDSDQRLDIEHSEVHHAARLQNDLTDGLRGLPELIGTAVGIDETTGNLEVLVLVDRGHPERERVERGLPKRLRGLNLRVEYTDPFFASAGVKISQISHTAKQTLPIQLGTSGGWRYDAVSGLCCGGTLGAAISFNGIRYILSNAHVLEGDTIAGGNSRLAGTGDFTIQPGLLDTACNASTAQNVGTLVRLGLLSASNTDAAVAKALTNAVRADGAILAVGTISAKTVLAAVGQTVKKSGRSTKLTRSSISGINATVTVNYQQECSGPVAFSKTFTGQILVKNLNGVFLGSGDSGSLLLEDVATNPRACGLLFASSGSVALANPINEVLATVGKALNGGVAATATMVGK